jgi:hypothetical protein
MTYYSTDVHGNKAVEDGYTINYKVDDYIAPEITLNTSDTVVHDVNNYYSSQAVSVYDNFYASSKISVEKKGKVNPFVLGLYVEQFTATDESGNTVTKNRYVKVVDRIAPSIITTAVNVCAGTPFWAMSEVAVEDNYYSNDELFPLVKIHSHNVNIWVAGVYYINYEVTDPSGNKSQVVLRPVMVQYPPDCENSFLGKENMSLSEQVMVYPNPSAGEVTNHSSCAYSMAGVTRASRNATIVTSATACTKPRRRSGIICKNSVKRKCSLRYMAIAEPSMASHKNEIETTSSIQTIGSENT